MFIANALTFCVQERTPSHCKHRNKSLPIGIRSDRGHSRSKSLLKIDPLQNAARRTERNFQILQYGICMITKGFILSLLNPPNGTMKSKAMNVVFLSEINSG